MAKLKRINFISTPHDTNETINLIFLSEGFSKKHRGDFYNYCKYFVSSLYRHTPFNLFNINNLINVYGYFKATSHHGIPIHKNKTEDTLYGVKIDLNSNIISFDNKRVFKAINEMFIYEKGKKIKLNKFLHVGMVPNEFSKTIVVILCPKVEYEDGFSLEWIPSENEYYFLATTLNKNWEQVVIKSICRVFSLGDEHKDTRYSNNPESNIADFRSEKMFEMYPNLVYGNLTTNKIKWPEIKWFLLGNPDNKERVAITQSKELDYPVYSSEKINLIQIEDRGPFKVYRSSQNCLMSYCIGDRNRPINSRKLPLCKVCEIHIRNELNKMSLEHYNEIPFRLTSISP